MVRLPNCLIGRTVGHRLNWYAHSAHPRMRQPRMSRSGSLVASPPRVTPHPVRSSLSWGRRRFWVGGGGALFWFFMCARPPAVYLLAPGVPLIVLVSHGLTRNAHLWHRLSLHTASSWRARFLGHSVIRYRSRWKRIDTFSSLQRQCQPGTASIELWRVERHNWETSPATTTTLANSCREPVQHRGGYRRALA